MIRKYIYGTPFQTEVIEKKLPITKDSLKELSRADTGKLYTLLAPDEVVYGLGQQVRGINKRGWIYRSNCTDDPNQCESREELYGAHNFFVIHGEERTVGVFLDTPTIVTYDVGYTQWDKFEISLEDYSNYELYIIQGSNVLEVCKEFRQLIGRSYIPPRWAFGMGQSRWGYKNEQDIKEVVKQYREHQIPIDSVYMDIDYMEDYKDFTVDKQRFPDLGTFAKKMKEDHIHLVPIIDAGVKIQEGYSVYEEGVENNYFCKEETGEDFVAAVWPGQVHFPDFLNAEAREWFGQQYKILLDQGIEGFWNDMNEPAIFYSKKHLDEVFEEIMTYKGGNLDISSFFQFKDLITGISNNKGDYQSFYHQSIAGKVRHAEVHNLYGYNMTRAAGEAFGRIKPKERILLFSRASMIGMHRYGGIWTGDNSAWWSQLLLNIKQMPSLNMCGFLFAGADIGGFGSNTTEDLLMRWMEFAIFTPLMRNHSALGSREQEPYQFERIEDFRNIIGLRYFFMPYIYSEYMKAALRDEQYFYTLGMLFPKDSRAKTVEDQLYVGRNVMIAPIYQQNATGRYVYLPEDMKCYKFRGAFDYEERILKAGDYYLEVNLNEVLIFVRKGGIVPVTSVAQSMDQVNFEQVDLLTYVKEQETYEYYTDDGVDTEVTLEGHIQILKS